MARLAQYCNLNRILMLSIGLWPYQQSKFTRFQFTFFYVILLTGIVFQLTQFITIKYSSSLVTKVLSSVSFCMMMVLKYNSFYFNIETMENFLKQLQHIHSKLKDKNEIAIVKKRSYVAKCYTIALTMIGICGIFSLIMVQICQIIANNHLQKNATEPYYLFFMEYFIDQKKCFYLILLHTNAIFYIGIIAMLGTGAMLFTFIEHICGVFRIASYRIEHAIITDQNVTLKNHILMTEGIICAVDIHRQAIKLSKYLLSKFEIMIFCFMGCVVICFSLSLFQLFQIPLSGRNINEFVLPFIYAFTSIIYMFVSNYIGQNVIDDNNYIFVTAYNVQWYRTPLHVQKMILFLLQRRSKEFVLNIGGIFNASIEGFATLVKASVSYFTLIHSTQ